MKKLITLLAATVSLAAAPALAGNAGIGVNISIGIPLPQVAVVQPPVVAYPGPGYAVTVPPTMVPVFAGNRYYRSEGGRWFCGVGHDGPWRPIEYRYLPGQLRNHPGWYNGYPRNAWNRGDDRGREYYRGWQPRYQQMAGDHDYREGNGDYRGRVNERHGHDDQR